jgi:hypothetical protein
VEWRWGAVQRHPPAWPSQISKYLNCDPANPPNGKVFSLTGSRHIPPVNGHYVSEMHLAKERAIEMDLFDNLKKQHLHTITREQAVMRYNEHLEKTSFRDFVNIV